MPQHCGQGGGQGDHPGALAGTGGQVQAGEQAGVLSARPLQRLPSVLQAKALALHGELAKLGAAIAPSAI